MEWKISRKTIENDPSWISSLGADMTKLHWRKGTLHATCNPEDDICVIHMDRHDPYDFPAGTIKHLWDWDKVGTIGIGLLTLYAFDKTFNKGKLTKQFKRELGL